MSHRVAYEADPRSDDSPVAQQQSADSANDTLIRQATRCRQMARCLNDAATIEVLEAMAARYEARTHGRA